MCGIFASNDPKVSFFHEKIIDKHLSFRGPDFNSGLIKFGNWKLYHSRLSIIAPSKKYSQPYHCDDGSVLLYNGEIFNFQKIAEKLKSKTISDTDLLSKIIINKNFNPNVLDGFFSIVRISKEGNLLNCIRDPFGVKPLYYFKRGNFITLSSEPSVIVKIFNPKLSQVSIKEYKIFRYPIFSGSYFNGINPVDPGSCLINKKYFDAITIIRKSRTSKRNNLFSIIKTVLNERRLSDVPVGLLLSSGVDSNIIRNMSNRFKKYFCGGFKNDTDVVFCKKLKKENKLPIEIVSIQANQFVKKFKELIKLRCEPLSVPNEVVLSLIAKKAKKNGIKVLISGEGADEFFAGYDRIFRWAKNTRVFDIKKFCSLYCYSKVDKSNLKKIKNFFAKINDLSNINKVKVFFIKFHLPILLRRLDFSLMSSGVEGREPFVSKKIFYESLKFSKSQLIDDNHGKKPLRKILNRYMNNQFVYEKKIGFPVDMNRIFKIPKKDKINESYKIWFKKNLEEIKKL